MKRRFEVEAIEKDSKLLIVDLFGKKETAFLRQIISHFSKKITTYVFTRKKLGETEASELSSLSPHFFDRIKNDIDYSLVLLKDLKERKNAFEYVLKLKNVSEKIVVIIPREMTESFLHEISEFQKIPNVSVVLLGEFFGPSYLDQPFTKIIANSITNGVFEINSNPLSPVFLVSDVDVILGLEYALFSQGSTNALYPLYYKTPNTITSLVHILKRVEPELSVSYSRTSNHYEASIINDEELIRRTGLLSESVRSVFKGFEKEVKKLIDKKATVQVAQNLKKEKRRSKSAKFVGKLSQTLFLLLCAFVLFIAVSVAGLFMSFYYFKNSAESIYAGNVTKAANDIHTAQLFFEYTKPQISFLVSQADMVSGSFLSNRIEQYANALSVYAEIITLAENSLEGSGDVTRKEAEIAFTNALLLYFLSQDKIIADIKLDIFTPLLSEKYLPLLSIFKEAAGYNREMSYLLLFQNDNELRPTGGFIGSVANIIVKNGKIKETDVRDVYELDGQLKEHFEPHFVIRRYLQPHLYLRDSNFNPDFENSASSAALLYSTVQGKKVDGVIAIDTKVLKALIEVLGPISITGVREKVTKDTIVSIIQGEIRNDFFPGSTEKKELLSTLLSKIVIEFESSPGKQISFLKKLPELLSQKHIQLSFNEDFLQRGGIAAGIAGSLKDLRIEKNVLKDTLSVNEANIGVNKVNEFVTRKISYSVFLKDKAHTSDILAEYKNSGEEDYTMYFRVLVPKNSLLESVVIDGVSQVVVPAVTDPVFYERRGFQPPAGLEVSEEEMTPTLKAFGFRIVVQKGQSKRIRLITERGLLDQPAAYDYSLLFIKQAGTLPFPLTVTLQTDKSLKKDEGKNGNSPVLYSGEVSGDIEVELGIQKTSQ